MSSGVINKYLTKKKKDLIEYAKVLESLITLENNTLWKTKQEFVVYAKEIIELYVDKNYFDNNIHRNNPVEYCNDNINVVLKSLIEYCKKENKLYLLQEKKDETFLLSVIITVAAYVDISTNVIDGNYIDTKEKFRYLLEYLKNTNILKVFINNNRIIGNLFTKIRNNTAKEEKFFNSFINDAYYNRYRLYSKDPEYYLVSFFYKVDGLDKFDNALIKEVNQEFKDNYLSMSYDLLGIEILKELISNGEVKKYIVPVTSSALSKVSTLKVLNDETIRQYVKILLNFNEYKNYRNEINNIEKLGFQFIYDFDLDGEVNQNVFTRNMEILVSSEMIKNNEEKIYSWKNQGIILIEKNKEEE